MKKLLSHLLEPRSAILGVAVFYFVSTSEMWTRSPWWDYHSEMFMATVLVISAVTLVVNRVWSDLVTAVLSGQLPFIFLAEFWRLSLNAELPPFSAPHIDTFIRLILSPSPIWTQLVTFSTIILSFSIVSIVRRHTALRASDRFDLLGE